MKQFFKLITDVGFPISASLASGYFVFLTLKFILDGVGNSIRGLSNIALSLDNRIKTMNHDIIRKDDAKKD